MSSWFATVEQTRCVAPCVTVHLALRMTWRIESDSYEPSEPSTPCGCNLTLISLCREDLAVFKLKFELQGLFINNYVSQACSHHCPLASST